MFGKPLVSVVIPCFNVEECLEAAVQSVFAQYYRPLDIILVDNKSTDKTPLLIKKIAKDHPLMVRSFEQKQQGAPAARNRGLQFAAGEWIQFLDADDLLLPEKIGTQMEQILKSDQTVGVASSAYQIQRRNGTKESFLPDQDPWLGLFRSKLGITSSLLWKKKALIDAGNWKEEQESSQEYELLFRILQKGYEVINTQSVETIVREREFSISNPEGDRGQVDKRWLELRMQIIDYLVLKRPELFERLDYQLSVELLKKLVFYFPYDQQHAEQIFRNYFPGHFRLKDREMGRMYKWLFNGLGFSRGTFIFNKYLAS